jgi:enoyl-CoA hydratase/carnithine racemase
MNPPIRVTRDAATAIVTIDREEAGNSISAEVVDALDGFFHDAGRDVDLRAVVITGAGGRFFAAGGDVKRYRDLRSREQLRAVFEHPRRLLDGIESFPLPVIAAINGWALGGGAELSLACDLRVMAGDARIGFPYAKLSLVAGWYGAERLVRVVGQGAARALLLRGEPVDACEAHRIGLVNEIAAPGGALQRATVLAGELAAKAPLTMGATKRVLNAIARESASHARAVADREFEELWVSEDHREAEAAFAEKRPPFFKGR